MSWHTYSASTPGITLLADVGDFFQLIGGANPWRLIECRVFQRALTAITMEVLTLTRDTGGSGGSGIVEYDYGGVDQPTPTTVCLTLPTTDVAGPLDLEQHLGWNMLQEAVWLPTPQMYIPCRANDDIGISQITGTANVDVGVSVIWQEFTGS